MYYDDLATATTEGVNAPLRGKGVKVALSYTAGLAWSYQGSRMRIVGQCLRAVLLSISKIPKLNV